MDNGLFSFDKSLGKLKSQVWYQKVECIEELLNYLVEQDSDNLIRIFAKEKAFIQIVSYVINLLKTESITRVVEVSLDFIEFLITSLPEAIIESVSDVLMCLIRNIQSKKESISQKANEIICIAAEILTADVLLPHLIGLLEEMAENQSQVSNKISALEVLNGLLKE